MELLCELLDILEEAKGKKKKSSKVSRSMAARVYHRDYVKTKSRDYRQYDKEEHKHSPKE